MHLQHLCLKSCTHIQISNCLFLQCWYNFSIAREQLRGSPVDYDNRQQLWNYFVSDARMVATIMEINPRWDPTTNKLYVRAGLQFQKNGFAQILAMLKFFCSWRKFAITRFASVSIACRLWICSLLVGLDTWFDMIRKDTKYEHDHMSKHFSGKTFEVRRYAVVASFSAMVSEGAALMLLATSEGGVCVWVKININLCIEICTYICAYLTNIYSGVCIYVYLSPYVYMYIYIYICVSLYWKVMLLWSGEQRMHE